MQQAKLLQLSKWLWGILIGLFVLFLLLFFLNLLISPETLDSESRIEVTSQIPGHPRCDEEVESSYCQSLALGYQPLAWEDILGVMQAEGLESIFQSHNLLVSFTTVAGNRYLSISPKIDEFFYVVELC